jgi:hypothetical protein
LFKFPYVKEIFIIKKLLATKYEIISWDEITLELNLTYIIETKFDETVISCKKNRGKQRTRI